MSNSNLLELSGGDKVLANDVEGRVVSLGVDSAFIELPVLIDGQTKIIKQWYRNDALKKIEIHPITYPVSHPVSTTEVKAEVNTDAKVVVDEPTIEMGVPGGSQSIKKIKKKGRNK
jgi:hypothetical protein